MTIAQLLSALFNLGAQTNFWNSNAAARDFWLAFAALLAVVIVYGGVRTVQHRLHHRHQHPFMG